MDERRRKDPSRRRPSNERTDLMEPHWAGARARQPDDRAERGYLLVHAGEGRLVGSALQSA